MEIDGFFEGLINRLSNNIQPKKEKKWIDVAQTSISEQDEWKSIRAAGEHLNRQVIRLMEEKRAVEARTDLFWYKLRIAHGAREFKNIKITNDTTVLQREVCEGESNCNGFCQNCSMAEGD